MNVLNEEFADPNSAHMRNMDFQAQAFSEIRDQQISQYNHTLSTNAQELNQISGIKIIGVEGFQSYQNIKYLKQRVNHNLHSCMLFRTFSDTTVEAGTYGPNFLIDTDKLMQVALNNGFHNMKALNQFVNTSRMINLSMSSIYAYQQLEEQKLNFVVEIAKIKFKENLRSLPTVSRGQSLSKSFQILAASFPLVDKDFPKKFKGELNTDEVKNSIHRIVQSFFTLTQSVFSDLKQ